MFEKGGSYKIGNGIKVDVWNDSWFPMGSPIIYRQDLVDTLGISRVADLLEHPTSG